MTTRTDTRETYNGWANYPTWNVNLWISNDEGLYNETLQRTAEAIAEADEDTDPSDDRRCLSVADALKNYVRDVLAPDLGASFAADLLGYALDLVDWFEIAAAWMEDLSDSSE